MRGDVIIHGSFQEASGTKKVSDDHGLMSRSSVMHDRSDRVSVSPGQQTPPLAFNRQASLAERRLDFPVIFPSVWPGVGGQRSRKHSASAVKGGRSAVGDISQVQGSDAFPVMFLIKRVTSARQRLEIVIY